LNQQFFATASINVDFQDQLSQVKNEILLSNSIFNQSEINGKLNGYSFLRLCEISFENIFFNKGINQINNIKLLI
jgi:hypothetical protein